MESSEGSTLSSRQTAVLVVAVFVAGLCSIVYELLIAATSSYFLGDSIKQFSLTIGVFMAAMGLGSLLSRRIGGELSARFVLLELALGICGGLSVPLLYLSYAYTELYTPAMLAFIVAVGALTGLEIPLLVRMLQRYYALDVNLSKVLSLDYFGALGATLLFPFALLPWLGTFKSALVIGTLNVAVALLVLRSFGDRLESTQRSRLGALGAGSFAVLLGGLLFADGLLEPWHESVYDARVLVARQSRYQKIVLTRSRADLRLYLNGNLQFSALDEHRYHETLVHPAMLTAHRRDTVLMLGGGDGLGVREVLKHADVQRVVLVDLDPEVTRLAQQVPAWSELHQGALSDPRVELVHEDAFKYIEESEQLFELVIVDLPDPNNASLSRLYSREFYAAAARRLARGGVLVTQATSPFYSGSAFWCIEHTMQQAGLDTRAMHAYVPSFGDWGFVIGGAQLPAQLPDALPASIATRFLDSALLPSLFIFDKAQRQQRARVFAEAWSTLDKPRVLSLYLDDWKRWN